MSTVFKVILVFISFICLWNLTSLPEMIVITTNEANLHETFVVTGIVIPSLILIGLGILLLLFSIVGAVLVTLFIVTFTLAVIGISFSWPVLMVGLILYWLFKQPNSQKV